MAGNATRIAPSSWSCTRTPAGATVEDVAARPAVGGEDVEVVPVDFQPGRVVRRPEPDHGGVHVGEVEFGLMRRRLDEGHARRGAAGGAHVEALEPSVHPHGEEHVVGRA